MSRIPKPNRIQIRPSVKIETSVILDLIKDEDELGITLEQLLDESKTFKKKKEQLLGLKGK
jgi:hypothetical protein